MTADRASRPDRTRVLMTGSGADRYGADEMLLRVATGLVLDGFDIHVTLPEDGPLTTALQGAGIDQLHKVPVPVVRREILSPVRLFRFLLQLAVSVHRARALLRELRPSLLWVNTIVTPAWVIAGRLERIPVICHSHEIVAQSLFARRVLYLPLLLSSRIIAVSGAVRTEITQTYSGLADRTQVLLNPAFEFRNGLAVRAGHESNVVMIGRLSPRKGQHVLLDALRLIPLAERPTVHMCGTPFRGYEWYEQQLRTTAEQHGLPVQFHGFVGKEDAYRLGGIVAIPSTQPDPCPLVALESLAAGRAVVASDCGGIPEIVEGAARSVPTENAFALAQALVELKESRDERDRLITAGRRRARVLAPEKYLAATADIVRSTVHCPAGVPSGRRAT